nr:oligosaccharide flippase family protein [Heyndrickxia coagulans]
MNIKNILKNASYLFMGNFGIRIITAISNILLARFIGPSDYGVFSIAIALSTVTGYFTDAGLSNTFMREATKKNALISVLISSYLRVRLVFASISLVISYIFIHQFYSEQYLINIISWIVYPTIIGMVFQGVAISYFQAREKMGLSTVITVIQGLSSSLVLFLAMLFSWNLDFISKLYGSTFILTGFIAILFILKYCKIYKGWNKNILNQLFVFTINGIIIMILPQLGPIILGKVSSLHVVGLFSTAFKIPSVLYQIPGVIATAFYPQLFKYGNNLDYIQHRSLSRIELKIMSFIGMGIAIPFIADPKFWIVTLLGKNWIESSDALSILSLIVVLQSINYPLADNLTTSNQQTKRSIVMSVGLIVSVLSYFFLGKKYGLMGSAFAAIITEASLLIGYCIFVKRSFNLLIHSIKYNLISFLICILAYKLLLSNNFAFIPLIGILYVLLVILFDKKLYSTLKLFLKKNKIHEHSRR